MQLSRLVLGALLVSAPAVAQPRIVDSNVCANVYDAQGRALQFLEDHGWSHCQPSSVAVLENTDTTIKRDYRMLCPIPGTSNQKEFHVMVLALGYANTCIVNLLGQ